MTVSSITSASVAAFSPSMASVRIAGNQITDKLLEAEAAIDAAIAAVAALTSAIPTATQEAQVGMHVTQEALMHAMESCQQLVKSRTNIIRTHSSLRAAQDVVGLGMVNFAPQAGFSCVQPNSASDVAEKPRMAAVAA